MLHLPDSTANIVTSSSNNLTVPNIVDDNSNTIEVPASRSSISNAASLSHPLSNPPSQRAQRSSRNSFGSTLPIPRVNKKRPLSQLGRELSFDILAAHAQDLAKEKVQTAKNMAFAFDIDGVLVHGDRLIPEAKEALDILNGNNELGIKVRYIRSTCARRIDTNIEKIPYIFLTNGSGKLEPERCAQLSEILQSPVSTKQFIQSHTPMSALAEYYSTVLVIGGEGFRCREIAEAYGFKDVIVPNDIVAWDEKIAPYRDFSPWERHSARPRDFTQVEIEAILVFSDSRDYATDYQIMMDLLRSKKGRLGTLAEDPVAERIPIYFSQGDLLCPTEYPYGPRMSQGAFRLGFEAMYKAITGVELERTIYGKPERATYTYADEILTNWMSEIHAEGVLPENVYMVGDNPQSDIIGGNMYGWNTCLVQTGVHTGDENDRENPASMGLFKNVLEAVKTCIKKELGVKFELAWDAEKILKKNPLSFENLVDLGKKTGQDIVGGSAIEVV